MTTEGPTYGQLFLEVQHLRSLCERLSLEADSADQQARLLEQDIWCLEREISRLKGSVA